MATPINASSATASAAIGHVVVLTYVDQDGLMHRIGLVDTNTNEVNAGIPLGASAKGDLTTIDLWEKTREAVNIPDQLRELAVLHTKAACVKKASGEQTYYHEVYFGQLTPEQVALLKDQTTLTPAEKKAQKNATAAASVYEAPLQHKALYDATEEGKKQTEILYRGIHVADDAHDIARQVDSSFDPVDGSKVNFFVAQTAEENLRQRIENKKLHKTPHQKTTLDGRTIHAELTASGQLKTTHATKGRDYCVYVDKRSIQALYQRASWVVGPQVANKYVAENIFRRNWEMANAVAVMYGDQAITTRQLAYNRCLEVEKKHFDFIPLAEAFSVEIKVNTAEEIKRKSERYTNGIRASVLDYPQGDKSKLMPLFERQLGYVKQKRESDPDKEQKETFAYYAAMKEVFGDPHKDRDAVLDKMRDEAIAAEWTKIPSPTSFKFYDENFELQEISLDSGDIDFTNMQSMREYWDTHIRPHYHNRLIKMQDLTDSDIAILRSSMTDSDIQERVEQLYLARVNEKDYQDAYERFQYLAADAASFDKVSREEPGILESLENNVVAFRMACHLQLQAQKRTIEGIVGATEAEKDENYRRRVQENIKQDSELDFLPDGKNIPEEFKKLYGKISGMAGINLKSFWDDFSKDSGQHIMLLAYLIVAIFMSIITLIMAAKRGAFLDPSDVRQMVKFNLKELSEEKIESLAQAVDTLRNVSTDGFLHLDAFDEKFFKHQWGSQRFDPEFNKQRRERAIAIMAAIAMAPPRNVEAGKIKYPKDLHQAQDTAEWLVKEIKYNGTKNDGEQPFKKVYIVLQKKPNSLIPVPRALAEKRDETFIPDGPMARLFDSSAPSAPGLSPSAPPHPMQDYYDNHIASLGKAEKEYILDSSTGTPPGDPNIMNYVNGLTQNEKDVLMDLIRDNLHASSPRPR